MGIEQHDKLLLCYNVKIVYVVKQNEYNGKGFLYH